MILFSSWLFTERRLVLPCSPPRPLPEEEEGEEEEEEEEEREEGEEREGRMDEGTMRRR